MKEYIIEFRVDAVNGLQFHGINELNAAIRRGANIRAIGDGEGIFEKAGEQEGRVRLVFSGCRIKIAVEE